tara:strand:- start:46 stop:795 length:750 start_codon:yes stop_codon:yes gene_type:complete
MNKVAIVIQARTNSIRLPNKIVLPFYQNKSILKLIIEKLQQTELKLYVATTTNPNDDIIQKIAEENKVNCFRGDENNVLSRYLSIAEENNLTHVIRVCSDNPFINLSLINNLIANQNKNSFKDYIGYFDKKDNPLILSHFGFFSEIISYKAMKKISQSNLKKKYHEHVTNYVYENPHIFKILKLRLGQIIDNSKNIRLTVDDKKDFDIASSIFSSYKGDHESYEELINHITNNTDFISQMKINIKKNKK